MTSGGFLTALIAAAALLSMAPLFFLDRQFGRRFIIADAAVYFAAIALLFAAEPLRLRLDPFLAAAIFIFVKIAVAFTVFVIAATRDAFVERPLALPLLAVAIQVALFLPALRVGSDGDEAYYLAITSSIVDDFDLDLRNQYAATAMQPQLGDPVGDGGQLYSRHEPFLSLLMVPGYLIAGRWGAIATIFFFSALFLWSLLQLLKEEDFTVPTRLIVFSFVAFGAPFLFYAMRIWPEVPAAFLFCESLRALRRGASRRLVVASAALALLKLRFVPIAAMLLLLSIRKIASHRRLVVFTAFLLALPFGIAFMISGSALNVHDPSELAIQSISAYAQGFFGLLLDGLSGLLFVAPLYFIALFVLIRARSIPLSLRNAAIAALPYLVLLFPRAEWHGGWSPPLRYVVVFMPLFALAAATAVERLLHPLVTALAAVATTSFAVYGVAYPWRLFHIANGEAPLGEYLSSATRIDYSRFIPSFIRLNDAAIICSVGAVVLAVALVATRRIKLRALGLHLPVLVTLVVAAVVHASTRAGDVVQLEDAHVIRQGGELYPPMYTVARFLYIAGWRFNPGSSAEFLARRGSALLYYRSAEPAQIEFAGTTYDVPRSPHATAMKVVINAEGRVVLRCKRGSLIVDRIEHE